MFWAERFTERKNQTMMKWYFNIQGGHTHVRVFMNGAKCGDLCFRNEEFITIRNTIGADIIFIDETPETVSA